MDIYYPMLLSRQKALMLSRISRKALEKLCTQGLVRTFKTKGGHNRYYRDDLIKYIYEQIR
jgi:hypothetical protein